MSRVRRFFFSSHGDHRFRWLGGKMKVNFVLHHFGIPKVRSSIRWEWKLLFSLLSFAVRGVKKKSFFLVEFDCTNFVCFDFHSVPASKSRFKIFRDISIRASEEMKEIHKVNTTPVDVEIKADKKLMITISFKAPTKRESSRPGSTTKGSIKY